MADEPAASGRRSISAARQEAHPLFYKGSEEELTPDKLQPGQRLSIAMGEHIKTTLFAKENTQKIRWEGTVTALSGGIRLSMTAGYFDMKVPLNIEIYSFGAVSQIPGTRKKN